MLGVATVGQLLQGSCPLPGPCVEPGELLLTAQVGGHLRPWPCSRPGQSRVVLGSAHRACCPSAWTRPHPWKPSLMAPSKGRGGDAWEEAQVDRECCLPSRGL